MELAPAFALDGRSLADFLDFVGRETGRTVAYTSPRAAQLANSTRLRGNVEIDPVRALDAILQTTDLEAEARGGALRITLRK
jgi:hypothetical protein